MSQSDIRLAGHAIECRINAESPKLGFQPCPGRITQWFQPQGTGIRVDSHCYSGYFISPYYDSLIAKVITSGADRSEAIDRMRDGLEHFVVNGIDTNIPFLQVILNHPDYFKGQINTSWIEHNLNQSILS
jgi:acetyl-CoA carboxylase biotin carboxylase subunit